MEIMSPARRKKIAKENNLVVVNISFSTPNGGKFDTKGMCLDRDWFLKVWTEMNKNSVNPVDYEMERK